MSATQNSSARLWLVIAIAFAFFWALYLTFFGPKPPPPPAPLLEGSGTGEPASFNWEVRDLEDRPVKFERFKGKPVFLNIWATWCPPCVGEMPSIARLADEPRLKDKGIEFVCVSTDDSTEPVRRFLEGRSWHMSFFRADRLPPVFLTDGIPATFIIAPDGRIAASEIGASDWDSPEVIALLEKLAAQPRGADP
jgi:thiol-disulfide isomerase/thioredoxin